jgi:hypothetical protein
MNGTQGHAARAGRAWRFLGPVFRGELGDGFVGVVGDLGQHVLEVVEGIDAPVAAGLDDGEEDCATLAAFGAHTRKVTPVTLDPLLLMVVPSSWAKDLNSDKIQIKQTMTDPINPC